MSSVAVASLAASFVAAPPARAARLAARHAPSAAFPTDAPLPAPRPRDLDGTRAPERAPPAPAPPPEQANAPAPDKGAAEPDCPARLRAAGWEIESAQSTSTDPACAIEMPIRIHKIPAAHFTEHAIAFPDAPVLACRFAERFGAWVRDDAAPLVYGHTGVELTDIRTGLGFDCRNRDHLAGGKISAHASGIAIDLTSFDLADKTRVAIPATDARGTAILASLRTSACGWFTTILGPGSDAYHATHIHVDILQHGSSANYRICE